MQTRNKMQTADSYWRHRQITLFWLSVDTPISCAKSKGTFNSTAKHFLSTVSLAGIYRASTEIQMSPSENGFCKPGFAHLGLGLASLK